jgi:hypothetical protein
MNEIKVKRLLLAGLTMFLVWVVAEILLEQMIGRLLFGTVIQERLLQTTNVSDWSGFNHLVNILVALLNSTLLIWLYAALRPMYGVGAKTALITSALCVVLGLSLAINLINLGLLPLQVGAVEAAFVAIEFPIAMLAGASVYEGADDEAE